MADWYFYENGQKLGPVTSAQLKALSNGGRVTPQTIVETESGQQAYASDVKGLFDIQKRQEPAVNQAAPPRQAEQPPTKSTDVLFVGQQHWSEVLPTLILCGLVDVLCIIVSIKLMIFGPESERFFIFWTVLIFLLFSGIAFYKYVEYRTTTMKITSDMVYLRKISTRKSIPISHIQSVETSTGLSQSLFGTSDLVILTGGSANTNVFKGSKDSQTAHDILLRMIKN